MTTTKSVRALSRGLEVIQALNRRHATSMSQLRELTGMSRATLLRMLRTLEQAGWVYRYRAAGRYRLGSRVCELGQHLLTVDQVVEVAGPVLDRLYQAAGLPLALSVCNGRGMRIIEAAGRMPCGAGGPDGLDGCEPLLWSASGRAYLAFCPAAEREAMLGRLRHSAERPDQAAQEQGWVDALLQDTRARGCGITDAGSREWCRNGERGIGAMAVPVSSGSRVRACLSLYWKEGGQSPCGISGQWLPMLRAGAEAIADDLLARRPAPDAAGSPGGRHL